MTSETTEADPRAAPHLVRELGLLDASMIVMGSMIGSGIFLTSAESARLVGAPGWLLLAWGLAGLLTITGALLLRGAGGDVAPGGGTVRLPARGVRPLFGFLFGWSLFLVVQTGTIAAVAVAFAQFLGVFAAAVAADRYLVASLDLRRLRPQPLDSAARRAGPDRGCLTATNTRGLRTGKLIQNTFTLTEDRGPVRPDRRRPDAGSQPRSTRRPGRRAWWNPSANGWRPSGAMLPPELGAGGLALALLLLGRAMIGPLFSQSAWNNVTFTGGEVVDPERTLPRALMLGCGSVVALYLLANVAYVVTLPFSADRSMRPRTASARP